MTDNHTELCERLDEAISIHGPNCSFLKELRACIDFQAARIQQQALEYVSLFDQCSQHLARIAELEREQDALRADAEGYRLIRAGRAYIEPQDSDGRVYVSTNEHGRYCKTADEFDAEIAAALQAEKETRS